MHVVATAGHVDHGKSALVRALTGMEPDRFAEERRRGMTLDLGFAWTTLPSGEQLAFVDVPGHERFVTNMLAGAAAVPAVLLVVAADEGWMPQSAEHLAALDALGVQAGVLAITRSDLADPSPAREQATVQIAGSSLGRAGAVESVAVSSATGAGLPELGAALDRLVARLPAPDTGGPVRLWLDRVFTVRGAGTVVTGTLQAGTVATGDELVLAPAMRTVRVRAVQALGTATPRVGAVARVALNLQRVSPQECARGMALLQPGRWTTTSDIDVRLEPLPDAEPPAAGRLTLHIGAARAHAQVRPLGGCFARLRLERPLPLHVGDRVLLRDPGAAASASSGRPVTGATVLDVRPPELRRRGAAAAAARELVSWPQRPGASDVLRRHRLLRAPDAGAMGLSDLPAPVAGDWIADPGHWQQLRDQLGVVVAAHADRDPLAPGLPADAARDQLGLPDRNLVAALAEGLPVSLRGGYLIREPVPAGEPGTIPAARPDPLVQAVEGIIADLTRAPFRAPQTDRLRAAGLDVRQLAAAERAGLLLRLPGNVVLRPDAVRQAAAVLAGLPQPFTAAQARQALGSTRRVVIPLLELMDRERVTRRLPGDTRVLR